MADNGQNMGYHERRAEMLKAALPYLGQEARQSLQLIVQVEEMLSCLHRESSPFDLSACDLGDGPADFEGMLQRIKAFCTPAEQGMVQSILNLLQAFRMVQMYREFMSTRTPSEEGGGEGGENGEDNPAMDFLMSQLPPEQRENFENMRMMMNVMNMT